MKTFRWPVLSFLALALGLSSALAACRRPTPPSASKAPAPPPVLVRFERTACYGPCPVDVLTVFADGRLRYEGRENAPRQGQFGGQLSPSEQAALVRAFEEARFFDFATSYKSRATDLPTYYLTFSQAGRTHKVTDYDGAPAALNALEDQLESIIDAPRWQPE
ncbi:DUF6438 domain-containing protein [uncultured Hymenobacter sp.]|uniref:DUF6438 domain-containing protein n=1 Tax=uncultured Hymenobacter sp. TaxID=170016 RepID=UPI0035C9F528